MSSSDQFDLVVIGSGPAGYVGAIRAAQLGMKTACIEKRKTLGGTCLNVGCIPSKALLDSSEHFAFTKSKLSKHGVKVSSVELDLPQMMKRKDDVVRQLTTGIAGLFKKNKIESIFGTGSFVSKTTDGYEIEVASDSGPRKITAKKVLIATGSEPSSLPFLPYDGKQVLSSTEALSIETVPNHLIVIGGGAIGLELGSVWARLGSKVTVVEFQDKIASVMDHQSVGELYKSLLKQGIEFKLGHKCLSSKKNGNSIELEIEEVKIGTKSTLSGDVVLVSTGRKPYTQSLGLDKIGLSTDKAGRIEIDSHFQTKAPGVYAVGDVVVGPMLAHKAEEEAVAAVEIMAGLSGHVNFDVIPNVIYTHPELASVGKTEEELKAAGIPYLTGSFPFMANARAKAMDETEGFVKILAHPKTDRVLGVHILSARASDLIAEAAAVMEFGGSSEDIARTCHAHPTFPEATKEAALDVAKRRINL